MLRLHISGSINDDVASVREDAIETLQRFSSSPEPYTLVVMDSGAQLGVKESVEEIENAIAAFKKQS